MIDIVKDKGSQRNFTYLELRTGKPSFVEKLFDFADPLSFATPTPEQPAGGLLGLGQPSSAELSTALNGSLLELNGRLNSTAACLVSRIVTPGHYDFSDFAIEDIRGSLLYPQ